jgi:glutamate-1-semialdehyde 2,1-aminomutase
MGCDLPKEGFLQGMRTLCEAHGILLIYDEVMTCFRLAKVGAQEVCQVKPDLSTIVKINGGGMPGGANGGKKEIMDFISPQGPVYQGGTLAGNPVAMAAGIATLTELNNNPDIYTQLDRKTKKLTSGILENVQKLGMKCSANQIGSMYTLFFTDLHVTNFDQAKTSDTALFGKYFRGMLEKGVYLAPSQYESLFITNALTDEQIEQVIEANHQTLKAIPS